MEIVEKIIATLVAFMQAKGLRVIDATSAWTWKGVWHGREQVSDLIAALHRAIPAEGRWVISGHGVLGIFSRGYYAGFHPVGDMTLIIEAMRADGRRVAWITDYRERVEHWDDDESYWEEPDELSPLGGAIEAVAAEAEERRWSADKALLVLDGDERLFVVAEDFHASSKKLRTLKVGGQATGGVKCTVR